MIGPHLVRAEAALACALRWVGEKEDPPGSNLTRFGEWFQEDGVPWCAIFMSYCFADAGVVLCDGFVGGPGVRDGKGCAWVPTIRAWLEDRGLWVGDVEPVPGDLAIFKGARHVGIVSRALGPDLFETVEGNAGNRVALVRRRRSDVDGFGRVR